MDNNLNDKWLMLSYSSNVTDYSSNATNPNPDNYCYCARKMSKITGVDFNTEYISCIIIDSQSFSYIYDTKYQCFDISDLKAKSWSELLIALDLAGCLFDEPRIP